MRPVRAETTIDAPREHVFELLSDLSRRPAFCDHFQHHFRLQRIEPRGVGAAARFQVPARGLPVWMESVIAELEPPHRIYERGAGGRLDRIPIVTEWELRAGPGESSEVTVTFWTEPSQALDRMREHLGTAGWYKRQWRRALARLKDLAESGTVVEPIAVAGASRLPT